jgi:hypothetical protein
MRTTQQFSITLPLDMAEVVEGRSNQAPMRLSARSCATACARCLACSSSLADWAFLEIQPATLSRTSINCSSDRDFSLGREVPTSTMVALCRHSGFERRDRENETRTQAAIFQNEPNSTRRQACRRGYLRAYRK